MVEVKIQAKPKHAENSRHNVFIPTHEIMGILFTKIHWLLADNKDNQGNSSVGIGFPKYYMNENNPKDVSIGNIISLIGPKKHIEDLKIMEALNSLKGYICIDDPQPVPEDTGYVSFYRVRGAKKNRSKGEIERRIRRAMKRHGYSEEEARALYKNAYDKEGGIGFPHLKLHSQSTGQLVRVAIGRKEENSLANRFDIFGFPINGGIPV